MIPLVLSAVAEAKRPFVTRLRITDDDGLEDTDSLLVFNDPGGASFSGLRGLISIEGLRGEALDGDVVLVRPENGKIDRLLRHGSPHNTLLVTERCDQLCVMCSQPPKKTHIDRFAHFEAACLLAEPHSVIGLTGGEPTLYKEELFGLIERVIECRPDIEFHVLSNAQHFETSDIERLRSPAFQRVSWGIPLYAADPELHDEIVGKAGAFLRLHESFNVLLQAGARIELRTVVVATNLKSLPTLADYVTAKLRFIDSWSIMQLEKIGFAKGRWNSLFVDHTENFEPIRTAIDRASLRGIAVRLFNFPRCTVPAPYRSLAPASISDWKRKYVAACEGCSQKDQCCGFFEWHPDEQALARVNPL